VVRTIIAPLASEVEAELEALPRRLRAIARRYIHRLRLEPQLGPRMSRGLLADHGCRRVYFDAASKPDDLFGSSARPARRGDQDLAEGPKWRIVYSIREAPNAGVRLIVILAVGEGHPQPARRSAYELAEARLRGIERRSR
jgi:hypothetical protein